jgi:hypothetical protein
MNALLKDGVERKENIDGAEESLIRPNFCVGVILKTVGSRFKKLLFEQHRPATFLACMRGSEN